MRLSSSSASRPVSCTASSAATRTSRSRSSIALGRAGLHDHHAHRVGDDVVQLARDAGTLVVDRRAACCSRVRSSSAVVARSSSMSSRRARISRPATHGAPTMKPPHRSPPMPPSTVQDEHRDTPRPARRPTATTSSRRRGSRRRGHPRRPTRGSPRCRPPTGDAEHHHQVDRNERGPRVLPAAHEGQPEPDGGQQGGPRRSADLPGGDLGDAQSDDERRDPDVEQDLAGHRRTSGRRPHR